MFIAKVKNAELDFDDILENIETKNNQTIGNYFIYIVYAYCSEKSTLGFIKISSVRELVKTIDWLNKENYAALISIVKREVEPIFFCHGKYSVVFDSKDSIDLLNISALLDKFCKLTKDPTQTNFGYLLDEAISKVVPIALLNNNGEFTFYHLYSKYIYNGIHYGIYGKPYKHYDPDEEYDYMNMRFRD